MEFKLKLENHEKDLIFNNLKLIKQNSKKLEKEISDFQKKLMNEKNLEIDLEDLMEGKLFLDKINKAKENFYNLFEFIMYKIRLLY